MNSKFRLLGSSILLVALVAAFAACKSKNDHDQVYSYSPVEGGPVAYGTGCGPSEALGGGSFRASGAPHSAFTAYHPSEGRLDPSGASCTSGAQCIAGIYGGPTVHVSLANLRDWVSKIKHSSEKLSPARCLAVSAFAKTHDWFGETCLDRSADSLKTWIRDCYKNDWSENARTVAFDCQLLGYHDDEYYGSSSVMREYLRGHEECEWSEETRHRLLSPQVIDQAVQFVRSPY